VAPPFFGLLGERDSSLDILKVLGRHSSYRCGESVGASRGIVPDNPAADKRTGSPGAAVRVRGSPGGKAHLKGGGVEVPA